MLIIEETFRDVQGCVALGSQQYSSVLADWLKYKFSFWVKQLFHFFLPFCFYLLGKLAGLIHGMPRVGKQSSGGPSSLKQKQQLIFFYFFWTLRWWIWERQAKLQSHITRHQMSVVLLTLYAWSVHVLGLSPLQQLNRSSSEISHHILISHIFDFLLVKCLIPQCSFSIKKNTTCSWCSLLKKEKITIASPVTIFRNKMYNRTVIFKFYFVSGKAEISFCKETHHI